MFGNIIFGGGIGAVIDHNTGSAYEYPTLIQVVMGMFSKVESSKTSTTQAGNSLPAPSPAEPSSAAKEPVEGQSQSKPASPLDTKRE